MGDKQNSLSFHISRQIRAPADSPVVTNFHHDASRLLHNKEAEEMRHKTNKEGERGHGRRPLSHKTARISCAGDRLKGPKAQSFI